MFPPNPKNLVDPKARLTFLKASLGSYSSDGYLTVGDEVTFRPHMPGTIAQMYDVDGDGLIFVDSETVNILHTLIIEYGHNTFETLNISQMGFPWRIIQ